MLSDTLTLGASPNTLVFKKQFADQDKSTFSVAGLTPATARTASVQHQSITKSGTRSVFDLSETDVDPGDPNGSLGVSRAYVVLQATRFKSNAAKKAMIERLIDALSDTDFVDAFLNREV